MSAVDATRTIFAHTPFILWYDQRPGQVPRIPRTTLSAVKVLVHSLSFFVVILRRGGGTPDKENIMYVTNWCFYLRLLTLLNYVPYISLNSISPMAEAWETWGGGGGILLNLLHPLVTTLFRWQVMHSQGYEHWFFFRYRSWDGYRPVSDFVDISLRARWGKLLLLEDYNRL